MVSTGYLVATTPLRLKYVTKIRDVAYDDLVFMLHYRVTAILLLIFSALLTCAQFFGDPIDCIKGGDVPDRIVNTFCWVEGTFTIPRGLTKAIGVEVAHPGVEKYDKFLDDDEVIEHKYYQWVAVVLFLQCCCFFVTHVIWKVWENRRMECICNDLYHPVLDESRRKDCEDKMVAYMNATSYLNKSYAYRYAFLELVNAFHVILQFIITDWFLGRQFITFGFKYFKIIPDVYDHDNPVNPMIKVFPKITKCTFWRFGPSGSVQKYDNLCLLPLNILNEKGYLVMWLWLAFLLIVSFLKVGQRLMLICIPSYRWFYLTSSKEMIPRDVLKKVQSKSTYGDWFVLHNIARNINPLYFRDLMICLAEHSIDDPVFCKPDPQYMGAGPSAPFDGREYPDADEEEEEDSRYRRATPPQPPPPPNSGRKEKKTINIPPGY